MKVLFIYTIQNGILPAKPLKGQEDIQFGISILSALLKKHGHITRLAVLDRNFGKKNQQTIKRIVSEFKPQLACFTSVNTEFEFVCTIAAHFKQEYPQIQRIIGGAHISLNPSEKELGLFNALCIGEGEYPLLEYINQIHIGKVPSGIENLWIERTEGIEKNSARPFIENLDDLPFPDREIWQEWILNPQTKLTLLMGRGCPFNCSYCSNHSLKKIAPGNYYRLRSPENIIIELEFLISQYTGINEVYLEVETLGVDLVWLSKLCDALNIFNSKQLKPIEFGSNLRVFPRMDFETVFTNLHKANIRSISIGLESGSERVRSQILKRNYSNQDILNAVDYCRKYGIRIGLYNLVGIPGETFVDFNETLKMNQLIQPDWHATSVFYPYKGTELYNLALSMQILPENLPTSNERQKALLDLPGFSKRLIQRSFDSFHFEVYKKNPQRKIHKLFLYYLQIYLGHHFMARMKNFLIRFLFTFKLHALTRKMKLFSLAQSE